MFFFFFPDDIQDKERLTDLIAWETVFGHLPLVWEELEARGLTLNRDEARDHYIHGKWMPQLRVDLYALLFKYHPALKLAMRSPAEQQKLLN